VKSLAPDTATATQPSGFSEAPDGAYTASGAGAVALGQLKSQSIGITFLENVIPEQAMSTTTITVKSQVTLPKDVREAVGLKPGDKVEVRATATGGVYIEKPGASRSYRDRLEALAKRRLIQGMTTDEFMEFSRGETAEYHRPETK
jgi:antitoxin PrlF